MPVVEVTFAARSGSEEHNALVDSGADACMIPIDIVKRLGARAVDIQYVRGVTGEVTLVELYEVAVQVGPHSLGYVRAVALQANTEIILGRDVLNQMVVTLNGPGLTTEIAD